MRVGGSIWELKIDPKRFRKKMKYDIEDKHNEQKREEAARSEQRKTKGVPRGIWKPSVVDLEAPNNPQELPT